MKNFKVGDRVKFSEKMNEALHSPFVKKDDKSRKIIDTLFGDFMLEGLPNDAFQSDELIPATFIKEDLQNGDILTDKDGDKSIYFDGSIYGNTVCEDELNDDLTADRDWCEPTCDIVKVERPIKFETVFNRTKEIKEMTMEELCEHFGCQIKIVKEEE